MLKIINEFKEFISRWNALDMAVWIIIWAAFWKIVSSLVDDIIMPPIWVLIGWVDFSSLKITLKSAVMDWTTVVTPAVTINYWMFINTLISFIIIMLAVFLLLKVVNNIFRKKDAAPAKPTKDQELLTEIRDLLKTTDNKKVKG